MTLDTFLKKLTSSPELVEFANCIDVIDRFYTFTPSSFTNGLQHNNSGENNGSCKIFAFGLANKLTKQQTLACFGEYYRNDVLQNPDAKDHQNIRQFMLNGWNGIQFPTTALTEK